MPAHQALTAKREDLPRVACHRRGDIREIARIAQKGTWRGPNVNDPEKQTLNEQKGEKQTLNEQKGGQGDEWARVEAQVRSEDLQAKEACDHNQRRRECPVCCPHPKSCDFEGCCRMRSTIRTTFGPGTWRPDSCYKEMKEVVTSFTDYELPLVAAMANNGTGIKQDEQTRFSIPVINSCQGRDSGCPWCWGTSR